MTHTIDVFSDAELAKILSVKETIRLKISYLQKFIPVSQYKNMFLSGGAIASLIQDQNPKDWDVYFTDEQTQKIVVDIFINHSDEIQDIDEKYRQVISNQEKCITENAITLTNGIQLITKHNGSPDDIRDTFDFVHCKPYYHFGKDQFFISREQYDLCYNKKLKINNMKAQTTWRQAKFEQRGYTWP